MSAGQFEGQSHLGALVSSMFPQFPPAIRVEGACASGGLALLTAEQYILSGTYQRVLVIGAEKMTDVSAQETTDILAGASHVIEESLATFPALYALLAKEHMREYGTTRENLVSIAVKNHHHAMNNPHAQFHKEITIEDVLKSPMVADPLRLLDCSPISDGASAVVISSDSHRAQARIAGFGHAQDSLTLAGRSSLTSFEATSRATKQALSRTEAKIAEFDAYELHDCFTIAEIFAIEDIGLCKKGASQAYIENHSDKLNKSGGLKGCGHPVGATGVKQVAFLAQQIELGIIERGFAQNIGGAGATAVVHCVEPAKVNENKGIVKNTRIKKSEKK